MPDDDIVVNPMDLVLLHDDINTLKKCLQMLPWYEQKILNLRFGLSGDKPKTLKECGNIFKCTKENIQLRQKAALTKLKELMSDSDKFFESKQYTKLYDTALTEPLS